MDIGAISLLAFLMHAVANSDIERVSPVETDPTDAGNPNSFTFEVSESEGSMLMGKWRIILERVDTEPQESALLSEFEDFGYLPSNPQVEG